MSKKALSYRELLKVLSKYGIREDAKRGKGSERMLVGVVDGRVERYPTKCHSEGDDKPLPVINAIRRKFKLTPKDGISDRDFYSR